MSPSSLTVLAYIATAWLLLNIWSRLRSRYRSKQHVHDSDLSESNTRLKRQQDAERLPSPSTSCLALQVRHGWLWLVVERASQELPNIHSKARQADKRRPFTSNLLDAFYTFGALVTLLAYVSLPFYLLFNLYLSCFVRIEDGNITASDSTSMHSMATTVETSSVIIPGLTVPLRDTAILFLASLLAITWHEAGHAFAAIL
jgi:hypothetical protein